MMMARAIPLTTTTGDAERMPPISCIGLGSAPSRCVTESRRPIESGGTRALPRLAPCGAINVRASWPSRAIALKVRRRPRVKAGASWSFLERGYPSSSIIPKRRPLPPVAVEQIAQAAENGSFLAPTATGLRSRGVDPGGEPRERQGLEPHLARAAQGREEQAFAPEQRGLQAAHELDVVGDARHQADEAAGIHAQRLARGERALLEHAARVHEHPAVAGQPLHDEALAAEQADAEALVEGDPERHALGGAQERILLADQLAAQLREMDR